MHGHGVYTLPSGDKYDGKYKENRKHGRGVQTWPNGEKSWGKWKDDQKQQRGPAFYVLYCLRLIFRFKAEVQKDNRGKHAACHACKPTN